MWRCERSDWAAPRTISDREEPQPSWNMDIFFHKLAMMMRGPLLDPSPTTTAVKNVFGHVTDVLQLEFKRNTAIGPDLSKAIILHIAVYDL
jgi:hypothetical protein